MLLDQYGRRKYLTVSEWRAFLEVADTVEPLTRSFCWTLAHCGGRISEVLALAATSIDLANRAVVLECLKRRHKGIFRAVPVPVSLLSVLEEVHGVSALQMNPKERDVLLWPWCRTTAWSRVKVVFARAAVPASVSMPKAFRHSFGVRGVAQAGVPLGTMKRWLGHSKLESTIVYTEAVGAEELALANRMWAL
jgi:integrase